MSLHTSYNHRQIGSGVLSDALAEEDGKFILNLYHADSPHLMQGQLVLALQIISNPRKEDQPPPPETTHICRCAELDQALQQVPG